MYTVCSPGSVMVKVATTVPIGGAVVADACVRLFKALIVRVGCWLSVVTAGVKVTGVPASCPGAVVRAIGLGGGGRHERSASNDRCSA